MRVPGAANMPTKGKRHKSRSILRQPPREKARSSYLDEKHVKDITVRQLAHWVLQDLKAGNGMVGGKQFEECIEPVTKAIRELAEKGTKESIELAVSLYCKMHGCSVDRYRAELQARNAVVEAFAQEVSTKITDAGQAATGADDMTRRIVDAMRIRDEINK